MIAKIRTTVYASLFSRKERRVVFHTEKIDVHRLFGACPRSLSQERGQSYYVESQETEDLRTFFGGPLAVVSAVWIG